MSATRADVDVIRFSPPLCDDRDSLRPAHLSRLRVPGGALEDLISLHAEWALGLDRFASLRAHRLAAGMPESMKANGGATKASATGSLISTTP